MIFGHLTMIVIKIFYWYGHKIWKLEMSIRRKWSKDLPLVNIIIKKFKEKDEIFNPEKFLEEFDQEKYFELLKAWKADVEKSYLDKNLHLRFSPVRHKKCLMSKQRHIKIFKKRFSITRFTKFVN